MHNLQTVTLQDLADAWRSMRLLGDEQSELLYSKLLWNGVSLQDYRLWFSLSSIERDKLGFHTD